MPIRSAKSMFRYSVRTRDVGAAAVGGEETERERGPLERAERHADEHDPLFASSRRHRSIVDPFPPRLAGFGAPTPGGGGSITLIGCGLVITGSRVIGATATDGGCTPIGTIGGDHSKKNGSIEMGTCVTPSVLSNVFVAQLAFRWYVTPLGKFARSGVLFPQNTP